MNRKGMTLLECLISLGLISFVVVAAFQFFVLAGGIFSKLREIQNNSQAMLASLDKIKADVRRAGLGLAELITTHIEPDFLSASGTFLEIHLIDRTFRVAEDAPVGAERLKLDKPTSGIRPGREIMLGNGSTSEILTVSSADTELINLAQPLNFSYKAASTSALLLEKITYFLDIPGNTLRREVNDGSAQPLLENVRTAEFDYDPGENKFTVRLVTGSKGELSDGFSLFPKNMALASPK